MSSSCLESFAAASRQWVLSPTELKVNERICVLAWQEAGAALVGRTRKLHLREDAVLMAEELNRDYPELYHWAAPANETELTVNVAQVARLTAEGVTDVGPFAPAD